MNHLKSTFELKFHQIVNKVMLSLRPLAFKICCCLLANTFPVHCSIPAFKSLPSIMKFFGWIQTKLSGGQEKKPSTTFPPHNHKKLQETREEFNDWPHNLLAIGTFGSKQYPSSPEVSPQESLQVSSQEVLARNEDHLPLDRFLSPPSMLELDKHISASVCIDEDVERMVSLILGKCKDIWSDDKKKSIGKSSASFLLQKMFACRAGFAPAPSPRDILQDSRMEKFLRTLLHKKMYPQNCSRPPPMKTCIDRTREGEEEKTALEKTHVRHGSKWVRTNSDYIVLEI